MNASSFITIPSKLVKTNNDVVLTPGQELSNAYDHLLNAKSNLAEKLHKYLQDLSIPDKIASDDVKAWKNEYIQLLR